MWQFQVVHSLLPFYPLWYCHLLEDLYSLMDFWTVYTYFLFTCNFLLDPHWAGYPGPDKSKTTNQTEAGATVWTFKLKNNNKIKDHRWCVQTYCEETSCPFIIHFYHSNCTVVRTSISVTSLFLFFSKHMLILIFNWVTNWFVKPALTVKGSLDVSQSYGHSYLWFDHSYNNMLEMWLYNSSFTETCIYLQRSFKNMRDISFSLSQI